MSLTTDQQITFLYTLDLAASAVFYEEVLGLTMIVDQGSCRIYHIAGQAAYLGLCERAAPRSPDAMIFTFVTQDVDAWYERITATGVACEHPPRVSEQYGIYHFFVRDPNGYLLEFQRFLDDDWNRVGH